MSINILYEDNHIIAVNKPAGILSQGDNSGQTSMFGLVKKHLKETYQKPGNVFLGIVQRLDRPVAGVLLFAKTSKGASRLSEQFRNREVEKTYQAVVKGKPKQNRGVLVNVLGKDEKILKAKQYEDGKEAVLHYELIKSSGEYSLLKISIEGGQFHQIRAQLSLAGMPILGDVKYGGQAWENANAIALCATDINFQAATEDKKIHLHVQIPKAWERYVM